MRAPLVWMVLATGCAPSEVPDGSAEVALKVSDEAEPAPRLTPFCVDDACRSVWLAWNPKPAAPVSWTVDGEPWGEADSIELAVELEVPVHVTSSWGEEGYAEKVLSRMPSLDEHDTGYGDPNIVILGYSGSTCDQFTIQTVGGCVTSGTDLRFRPSVGSDTVFPANPSPSSVQLGNGYAAWFVPLVGFQMQFVSSNVPATVQADPGSVLHSGYEYWFQLAAGTSHEITAYHEWFGGGQTRPHRMGIATCSGSGGPGVVIPGGQ